MRQEDFVLTVGYNGDCAVVDARLKDRLHAKPGELADEGHFKMAFCLALVSGNEDDLKAVMDAYAAAGVPSLVATGPRTIDDFKRLFGVFGVPEGIARTLLIR